MFNTITFLLNIVDDDKLADIEKWLLENEPEVLFLTEKGRLGESTQHQIFRRYFNEISVEKHFGLEKTEDFQLIRLQNLQMLIFDRNY